MRRSTVGDRNSEGCRWRKPSAFASGEAFLASPDTRRPDCAIVDVQMDGLTGFETKARLRALHCDVPVVFITASDDAGLDRSAAEANGVTPLRRRFSNEMLVDAVEAAWWHDSTDAT